MSLSTSSTTGKPYTATNSGGAATNGIEELPARIMAGVESVGSAAGDVASATVSFSAKALQALEDGGKAVLAGAEDVVMLPYELAKDAAQGVEHVVEGGWHLLSDGVQAVASGVASAAHAVAIDLPGAIASDIGNMAKSAADNAGAVAGAAATVAALTGSSGMKVIGALL